MSGHNKWSKIKHKKAKTDAQKSASFTKVIREIMSAVKSGGTDPNGNFKLRLAIEHAKEVHLPASNIENAIKKGSAKDAAQLDEIIYEGYAPGGVPMLVEAMTDNRNRTVAEVRSNIEKNGGKFAVSGAVAWMFEKKGVFGFEVGVTTEEKLMEVAIDAGADDIKAEEDKSLTVLCSPEKFEGVKKALEDAGLKPNSSELTMVAKEEMEITDIEKLKQILALTEKLEELDDVQKVHVNFKASDDLMHKAMA
jgi:YebC/PmpR family DNA-binding regulatory protein